MKRAGRSYCKGYRGLKQFSAFRAASPIPVVSECPTLTNSEQWCLCYAKVRKTPQTYAWRKFSSALFVDPVAYLWREFDNCIGNQ